MCLKFYLKMYALDTDAIILFTTNNIFSLKRNHFRNDGNDSHADRCIASQLLATFNLGRQTMKQMDQRTSFVNPFQRDVHYSTHASYTTLPSSKTCIWFAMIKYDTYIIWRFHVSFNCFLVCLGSELRCHLTAFNYMEIISLFAVYADGWRFQT